MTRDEILAKRLFSEAQVRCQIDSWSFNPIQMEEFGICTDRDRDRLADIINDMYGEYLLLDPRDGAGRGCFVFTMKDGYHLMHVGPPVFEPPGFPLTDEGEVLFNNNMEFLASQISMMPRNFRCFDTDLEGSLYAACMQDGKYVNNIRDTKPKVSVTADEKHDGCSCVMVEMMPAETYVRLLTLYTDICNECAGLDRDAIYKRLNEKIRRLSPMSRLEKIRL